MALRLCHDDHILVKNFEEAALSASGDSLRKLLFTALNFGGLSDAERIEYRLAGISERVEHDHVVGFSKQSNSLRWPSWSSLSTTRPKYRANTEPECLLDAQALLVL